MFTSTFCVLVLNSIPYHSPDQVSSLVLKGQAEGAKVFNGSLKTVSGFIPRYLNGIEIDGSPYIPYQCSFNANEDTWSGEWYGIELSTNTQNVEVNITSFDVFDGQEANGGGDIVLLQYMLHLN